MPRQWAAALVQILESLPHVAAAQVIERGRTCAAVAYCPSDPGLQSHAWAVLQQDQIDKARAELDGYLITLLPGDGALVASAPKKGLRDRYTVRGGTCDCPAAHYQYGPAGILCKHACAARIVREAYSLMGHAGRHWPINNLATTTNEERRMVA